MNLRLGATIALVPALVCVACGTGRIDATATDKALVTTASTPTFESAYQPASRQIRKLAVSFIRTTLEYDPAVAGRTDFLEDVAQLATHTEVERLQTSPRARLPWAALRARGESTELRIDGITRTSAPTPALSVFVWLTLATHTDFARVRTFELVTLTLVPTTDGWKVDHAMGAGL